MAISSLNDHAQPSGARARAEEIDRHVGSRIRARRVALGLSQQEMADLIGVTYQQAHKYERGINRLASGRLWLIADALGVDVSFFFDGLHEREIAAADPRQRLLLELARNFTSIPNRRFQEALAVMARTLADDAGAATGDLDPAARIPLPVADDDALELGERL